MKFPLQSAGREAGSGRLERREKRLRGSRAMMRAVRRCMCVCVGRHNKAAVCIPPPITCRSADSGIASTI